MQDKQQLPDASEALALARQALDRLRAAVGERAGGPIAALAADIEDAVAKHERLIAARGELSGAIRRRPLTALAVAFGAGLALALLTRG